MPSSRQDRLFFSCRQRAAFILITKPRLTGRRAVSASLSPCVTLSGVGLVGNGAGLYPAAALLCGGGSAPPGEASEAVEPPTVMRTVGLFTGAQGSRTWKECLPGFRRQKVE
jgi:hypothetical protein